MSFSLAQIQSRVAQITGRTTSDVTSDLLDEALTEISRRLCPVHGYSSGSNITTAYITRPTGCIAIDGLQVDGNTYDAITWDEYISNTMEGYIARDDKIYIKTLTQTSGFNYEMWWRGTDSQSNGDIMARDEYKMAVVHLVAAKVYENFELSDKEAEQRQKYESEIQKIGASDFDRPYVCLPNRLLRS